MPSLSAPLRFFLAILASTKNINAETQSRREVHGKQAGGR